MLEFMKEMEKFCIDNDIRLNVYVVSNGGFIEGCQNRPLMQVMENFCKRCNFQWRGGVGIGGGVMLNVMRIMFFGICRMVCIKYGYVRINCGITGFCRAAGSCFIF